jgi:hypothetical protein
VTEGLQAKQLAHADHKELQAAGFGSLQRGLNDRGIPAARRGKGNLHVAAPRGIEISKRTLRFYSLEFLTNSFRPQH